MNSISNTLELMWACARAVVFLPTVLLFKLDTRAGVPLRIFCPKCSQRHVDMGIWAFRAHVKHLCAGCGHIWEPTAAPKRWISTDDYYRGYYHTKPTRGVSYDFDLDGNLVPNGDPKSLEELRGRD